MIERVVFFALGCFFLFGSFSFPSTLPGVQSASFWPRTLAVSLLLIAIFSPRRHHEKGERGAIWKNRQLQRTGLVCIGYIPAWMFFGFIPSTLVCVFLLMILLQPGAHKIIPAVFYSISYCFLLYIFFHMGMRVPL